MDTERHFHRIVLIHEPHELNAASNAFPPSHQIGYCCLSPHAIWACERRGITCTPLEDYDHNSEADLLKEKVHHVLLRIIELADQVVKEFTLSRPYISPF